MTALVAIIGVIALLANGCPPQAIVAAYGLDERTVANWQERAGKHSQVVHEHLVQQPRELEHVQADEVRVQAQGQVFWMATLAHARSAGVAAGIADHCWTVQELLSYRVPPAPWTPPKRRGRPSNAMKQLQARWCL